MAAELSIPRDKLVPGGLAKTKTLMDLTPASQTGSTDYVPDKSWLSEQSSGVLCYNESSFQRSFGP